MEFLPGGQMICLSVGPVAEEFLLLHPRFQFLPSLARISIEDRRMNNKLDRATTVRKLSCPSEEVLSLLTSHSTSNRCAEEVMDRWRTSSPGTENK
jgi:hypothetical protein